MGGAPAGSALGAAAGQTAGAGPAHPDIGCGINSTDRSSPQASCTTVADPYIESLPPRGRKGLNIRPASHPNHRSLLQAPFGTQLKVLSVRLMRNAYRHPLLVALNFLATLAAAVGLALIFHNTGTDTSGIQNRCARAVCLPRNRGSHRAQVCNPIL